MSRIRSEQEQDATQPRTFRKLRFFLFGLLLVGILFFFLPTILVNTPLKQAAIDFAVSDVNGTVSVNQISAGWFSPVKIQGIVLRDADSTEIVSIESIATTQTLFGFVTSSDYGTVQIDRPAIDLVTREGGSNLEDVFAKYMESADSESTSTQIPRIEVKIANGVARLRSESIKTEHVLENINSVIRCRDDSAALVAQLQCDANSVEPSAGKITVTVLVDQGQVELAANTISADIATENLPASVLAPILTRFIGPTNCVGIVDGTLKLDANAQDLKAAVNIESLHARQVALVAPMYLGSDQFSAANLTASGDLQLSPTLITASQFKAESEFARIQANGHFDIEQLIQLASGDGIPQSGFQLDGIFDLAQITTMLPETTRIRDGVQLKSGLLQVQANTRDENGTQRLVVNADAANINVMVNGQEIAWQRPMRFVATAGKKNGRLLFENIQLQSDFLNASGFAAIDSGQLQIAGDLQKVMNQLGQVLDLGDLRMAGTVDGNLQWQTDAQATAALAHTGGQIPIELNGRFHVTNPHFQYPGFQPWQENELDLELVGNTIVSTTGSMAVNAARCDVKIGDERAVGVLNEKIADLMTARKFQFNCQATGSIAKWLAHARNFAEFPDFVADGNLTSQFILTLNPKTCRINQLRFQATDFNFDGFSMNVREPSVTGKTNIKYDFNDYSVLFTKATVSSPSIAASTDQLKLHTAKKLLADGVVSFRANADRTSNWFGYSMPGDSVRWDGAAAGTMSFSSESGLFGGDLNAEVTDLVFVQPAAAEPGNDGMQTVSNQNPYSEIWREPHIQVASQVLLSDDFNNVKLRSLDLKSKMANIQGRGTLNDLAGAMIADWTGRWNVKWENVNQTIREIAGDVVTFEGDGWRPLEIRGPLFEPSSPNVQQTAWVSPELSAVAAVAWKQATVLKMPLGKSQVDIQLNRSLAEMSSQANTGMVDQLMQLRPVLDLRQADPLLNIGPGRLLDQWRITADDSRTWLKYAAPLIADATSAEGQVSVEIEGANVPLFDPMNSSARGSIQVHELVVGPGPLAQQLLPLIDQIRAVLKPDGSTLQDRTTWLQLKPQNLPIVVQQGRVFHEGFEMNYKEFVIRTRGSVGFDQTMNLVADIPILDEWVSGNKMLSGLSGKSISIPISGTLTKPQLDRRIVSQLTQQLIRDSAMGAVNEKVSSEVNKLQEKVGGQVQGELNRFQDKINNKIQSEFENKLQNELRGGLNSLFGGDKNK